MSEMIPFGKYRGQPVEVLENDPEYAEWLKQQDWVREKHPRIINIIINKFGEAEETPEHNAMQAKFMSKGYCAMLGELLGAFDIKGGLTQLKYRESAYRNESITTRWKLVERLGDYVEDLRFEVGAIDVSFRIAPIRMEVWITVQHSPRIGKEWGSRKAQENWKCEKAEFLVGCNGGKFNIELKPTIGDDYPAVLRQMRNNGSYILVYGMYTGSGVSESVFRNFFESQGIKIFSESEISFEAKERADAAKKAINDLFVEQMKILKAEKNFSCHLFSIVPVRTNP